MENLCHLSIDTTKGVVIAVCLCSICHANRSEIAVKCLGYLAHVVAGAAKEVVGTHAFVGCAVAVVVTDKGALEGVGTEDGVALVLCVEQEEVIGLSQPSPKASPNPSKGKGDAIALPDWSFVSPLPLEGLGEAFREDGAML